MEILNEQEVRNEQIDQEAYTKSKEKNQHISSLKNLSKLNDKKFLQIPNEDYQMKFKYVSENTELNLNECIIDKHLSEKNVMTHDKYSIDYEHPELNQNLDQFNTDKNLSFMNSNDLLKEAYDSLEEKIYNKRPSRKSAKEARKVWIDSHGIEDIPNNVRRPKHKPFHPVKTKIQEDTNSEDRPLPIWAQKLTSVRLVDKAWIIGFVTSEKELQETIEGHCRNVVCDYIKSHPCTMKKRHIQRNQSSRLMWKNARVEFDGIPFTINSSDERRCIFAMNYKPRKDKVDSKSQKIDDMIEIEYGHQYSVMQDESDQRPVTSFDKTDAKSLQKTRRYKDVLFTDCPAKILIKSIEKYPEYAVPITSLMPEKKAQLSRLREDLQKNLNITKEHLYHITLPLESCHNHPLTGRSRNIHPDIVSKVKEYVNHGYTTPKIIKGLLMAYIETVHQNDSISPQIHDRAYYPEVRDIANIIHTHCKRNGIIGKRRIISGVSGSDIKKRKRLKKKKVYQDGSTSLEEAVETFCKDEPGSLRVDGSPQHRGSSRVAVVEMPDAVSVGDMVRSQLDHLRTLTYSINQSPVLCDMYKSIQDLINHYGQHTMPKDHIAISEMNLCDVSDVPDVPNVLDSTSENMNTSKLEVVSRQYQSEFTNNGKPGVNVSRKGDNLATSTLECLAQAGAIHASLSSNMNGKSQAKPHSSNNNDNQILIKQPFLQSSQAIVSGQSLAYEVLLPHAVSSTTAMTPHNLPANGVRSHHNMAGNGVVSHHNMTANMLPATHSVPISGAELTHNVPSNGLMPSHNISTNELVHVPGTGSSTYQSLATATQETSGGSVETPVGPVETSGGPVQLALQHYVYYVQEAQIPEGQSWAYPSNT